MLLDYIQSSARSRTITLNPIRIVELERRVCWNLRCCTLLFKHVAIVRWRAELSPTFSLADAFQQISACAKSRRHERVKGYGVTQHDGCNQQQRTQRECRTQKKAPLPACPRKQNKRDGPKEKQQHRVGSE